MVELALTEPRERAGDSDIGVDPDIGLAEHELGAGGEAEARGYANALYSHAASRLELLDLEPAVEIDRHRPRVRAERNRVALAVRPETAPAVALTAVGVHERPVHLVPRPPERHCRAH